MNADERKAFLKQKCGNSTRHRNKKGTLSQHETHWKKFRKFSIDVYKKDHNEDKDWLFPELPETILVFLTNQALISVDKSQSLNIKSRSAISDYYKCRVGLATWNVSENLECEGNPMGHPEISLLCQSVEKAKKRS